jgi:hypothetical protein
MHNATDVSVYPNPSKGIFQVSGLLPQISGSLSVAPALEIFNVLGEKVYSAIVNANQETVSLDVPVGIYFLYIKTTQGTAVQKLVIHK